LHHGVQLKRGFSVEILREMVIISTTLVSVHVVSGDTQNERGDGLRASSPSESSVEKEIRTSPSQQSVSVSSFSVFFKFSESSGKGDMISVIILEIGRFKEVFNRLAHLEYF